MLFQPATGFSQHPARGVASEQFAVRQADFRSEIRPLDVDMWRIFILEEHQKLEAAKAPDLWHQDSEFGFHIGQFLPYLKAAGLLFQTVCR